MYRWEITRAALAQRVFATIRSKSYDQAAATADTLLSAGLTTLEISLTTPFALEAVTTLVREVGDDAVIGAGTVLDAMSARMAIDAGARFLLSPNLDEQVLRTGHRYGVPVFPGRRHPHRGRARPWSWAPTRSPSTRPPPTRPDWVADVRAIMPQAAAAAHRRHHGQRRPRLGRRRGGRRRHGLRADRRRPRDGHQAPHRTPGTARRHAVTRRRPPGRARPGGGRGRRAPGAAVESAPPQQPPGRRDRVTTLAVPGSKSVTARALFLAAAAEGVDDAAPPAGVRRHRGLRARPWPPWGTTCGAATATGGSPAARRARPRPRPTCSRRDAATASRFLPALAAAGHGTFRFDASAQMRRRPLGPLTRALRTLGVDLRARGRGRPPAAADRGARHQGRRDRAGREPVLAVPDRAAAGRPAHRGRAADQGDRHRLGALRRDHPRDDALLRGRRGARGRHVRGARRHLPGAGLRRRAGRLDGGLLLRGGGPVRPQRDRAGPGRRRPPGRPALRGRAADGWARTS